MRHRPSLVPDEPQYGDEFGPPVDVLGHLAFNDQTEPMMKPRRKSKPRFPFGFGLHAAPSVKRRRKKTDA